MTVQELAQELEHKPPTYKVVKAGTTTEVHEVVTDHVNEQVKLF